MTTTHRPFVNKTPMQMALAQDLLHNLLKTEVLRIYFEKLDGSFRKMKCTLTSKYLPKRAHKDSDLRKLVDEFAPTPNVITVWDIDAEAWRSIRYESIIDAVIV